MAEVQTVSLPDFSVNKVVPPLDTPGLKMESFGNTWYENMYDTVAPYFDYMLRDLVIQQVGKFLSLSPSQIAASHNFLSMLFEIYRTASKAEDEEDGDGFLAPNPPPNFHVRKPTRAEIKKWHESFYEKPPAEMVKYTAKDFMDWLEQKGKVEEIKALRSVGVDPDDDVSSFHVLESGEPVYIPPRHKHPLKVVNAAHEFVYEKKFVSDFFREGEKNADKKYEENVTNLAAALSSPSDYEEMLSQTEAAIKNFSTDVGGFQKFVRADVRADVRKNVTIEKKDVVGYLADVFLDAVYKVVPKEKVAKLIVDYINSDILVKRSSRLSVEDVKDGNITGSDLIEDNEKVFYKFLSGVGSFFKGNGDVIVALFKALSNYLYVGAVAISTWLLTSGSPVAVEKVYNFLLSLVIGVGGYFLFPKIWKFLKWLAHKSISFAQSVFKSLTKQSPDDGGDSDDDGDDDKNDFVALDSSGKKLRFPTKKRNGELPQILVNNYDPNIAAAIERKRKAYEQWNDMFSKENDKLQVMYREALDELSECGHKLRSVESQYEDVFNTLAYFSGDMSEIGDLVDEYESLEKMRFVFMDKERKARKKVSEIEGLIESLEKKRKDKIGELEDFLSSHLTMSDHARGKALKKFQGEFGYGIKPQRKKRKLKC